MNAKSTSRAGARTKAKGGARAKTGTRAGSRAKTAGGTKKAGRGLLKAVSGVRGKRPLKSTSEKRAKRGSSRPLRSASTRGTSAARKTRARRPLGTNRPVSASTQPSFGNVEISDTQRMPVEDRQAPNSDKPYTGADAYKSDAKGAQGSLASPPRKPIRQVRDQVGVRHH